MIRIFVLVCALGVAASSGLPAPMRLGPHCVLAAALILQAAQPAGVAQLPPAGNPGHVEPAPGQMCAREATTPADHRCACHRVCQPNVDDEGNAAPGAYVQEDPKCRVYCYKSHCSCPVEGCE